MFTQFSIYLIFVTVIYLNIASTVSATSANMEQSNRKRFSLGLLGRFGLEPYYLFANYQYYDDDIDNDVMFYKKRQLKRKWTDFFQTSQSPYTIAFPALIRTRRWIEQEQ